MIEVAEGDAQVPGPQSEELFMALKRLGGQTELSSIPELLSEFRIFATNSSRWRRWRGEFLGKTRGTKFAWRDLLKTLDP